MKKQVEECLSFADEDIAVAFEITPAHTRMVAFHCQQSVEKYFKAYLIENNRQLQKTHAKQSLR